jgi:hypothetical protein
MAEFLAQAISFLEEDPQMDAIKKDTSELSDKFSSAFKPLRMDPDNSEVERKAKAVIDDEKRRYKYVQGGNFKSSIEWGTPFDEITDNLDTLTPEQVEYMADYPTEYEINEGGDRRMIRRSIYSCDNPLQVVLNPICKKTQASLIMSISDIRNDVQQRILKANPILSQLALKQQEEIMMSQGLIDRPIFNVKSAASGIPGLLSGGQRPQYIPMYG